VNIAINDILLKLYCFGYISLAECVGVSSTTYVMGPESYGEITQTTWPLRHSRSL